MIELAVRTGAQRIVLNGRFATDTMETRPTNPTRLIGCAMTSDGAYHELCCYTLAHRDPSFLHQHVVDAFAAQHADEQTKRIKLTFALVGLYLHVEMQFSGRQVQRVHMNLATPKRLWPSFALPADRGILTAADVLAVPAGPERDQAIHAWCASVWEAFHDCRPTVVGLLQERQIV